MTLQLPKKKIRNSLQLGSATILEVQRLGRDIDFEYRAMPCEEKPTQISQVIAIPTVGKYSLCKDASKRDESVKDTMKYLVFELVGADGEKTYIIRFGEDKNNEHPKIIERTIGELLQIDATIDIAEIGQLRYTEKGVEFIRDCLPEITIASRLLKSIYGNEVQNASSQSPVEVLQIDILPLVETRILELRAMDVDLKAMPRVNILDNLE